MLWLELGFGVLTLLLVALGIFSTTRLDEISEDARVQVEIARPRAAATRELEIHGLGYALNVRSVLDGFAVARSLAEEDVANVAINLAQYKLLARNPEEHELAARFAARWGQLHALGETILAAGQATPEEKASFLQLRLALMRLLDDEMQPDALASQDRRTGATRSNLDWTKGITLLLLFACVSIALVTSVSVARKLRRTQQELMLKERLAVLGQVAGSVAHHVRSPLCVIQNSVFFLEQSIPPDSGQMHEVLGEMKRAVANSNHIITEMLDYVREPSSLHSACSIGEGVSRALQLVALPGTIQLQNLTSEATGFEVQANLDRLTRILANLIQNAADAMPQGGQVAIHASRKGDDKVCVEVRDTGCGIPPENLAKVFDPLFSTRIRAVGLGLAIAQRYAKADGGSLSVESEVGRGTTFRLTLPVAQERSPEKP